MFVRYEDLVTDSHNQTKRVSSFIGSKVDIVLDIKNYKINKWKKLPFDEKDELTRYAQKGLSFFGYLTDKNQ